MAAAKQENKVERADLYVKLRPGPGQLAAEVADSQRLRIMRAMTQIVAERGYWGVKVRDVVKLGGVSTRSFYEHFASKEDCFIRTYEMLVRRASRKIIASQVSEEDWKRRPEKIFRSFARGIVDDPSAAHLVLVEAHRAGPAALECVLRSERTFEAMVAESLARQPDGVELPPPVIEGMVAGVAHVARARLASGRVNEIPGLGAELTQWAIGFQHEATMALLDLDPSLPSGNSRVSRQAQAAQSGDRALIIAAVGKLVASRGYHSLTIPRIRSAAGISRRKFDNHFDGVEQCFVAALELHVSEALARSAAAQAGGRSWPGGIYRAIDALCDQIIQDPFLAAVCLADGIVLGPGVVRCQQRLAAAVVEQLRHSVPRLHRPADLITEASAGALWALFQRYVARASAGQQRPQAAPTLSYMALAPVVGPAAAMAAIRREQDH